MKYNYLHAGTGLAVYCYSMPHPIIFIFEKAEQRENIFNFLLNKVKFQKPLSNLSVMSRKWEEGQITNFEYLNILNTLASRSVLNLS